MPHLVAGQELHLFMRGRHLVTVRIDVSDMTDVFDAPFAPVSDVIELELAEALAEGELIVVIERLISKQHDGMHLHHPLDVGKLRVIDRN